ncbi:MAG: AzlD domain-containing protein [Nitriliruptoraceae bacterium]|nr:AzlD domain-containing protein [Nitriliruptoraceae bacterium]
MSLLALVGLVAAVTLLSRVAPMVLLPVPDGYLATVVARLPAPLFAALAVLSLLPAGGHRPSLPAMVAVLAALVVAPRRSLLITVLAGLTGYLAAAAVLA